MESTTIKIAYNKNNGNYEIIHKNFSWVSDGRKSNITIRKKNKDGKYVNTVRSLQSAKNKQTVFADNKITTTYSGFVAFGKKLPFSLVCTAEITSENTVEFSLKAENETDYDIQAVYFPAPFNSKKKGKSAYHIDSMRQGFIMPDGKLQNLIPAIGYTNIKRQINSGDAYMPVWGRVCDSHSFTAIVETPYDASMFSSLGKHGAFINSVYWLSSLGKLSYERKLRFIFHENGDYNTVAKDYRKYLLENNKLVTIDKKITKNPNIKNIIGAPVLHHKIFSKINKKSQFYDKNGTNEILCATFTERSEQIKKLKELGLEKLYIHTDGWGKDGYDNNHPYILPPCEQAGGWEGFREFSRVSRELGYVFALHDQYRDYYYDSPVFDKQKAVTNIDGSNPYCSIWDGGEHTYLCSSFALDAVKKTYTELEEQEIDVQGAYLDVFSIMPGDECFNKEHRITREESMHLRGECFDFLNNKGLIMSSEEPGMQMLNHLALVHHGPHALIPQENGKAVGIPIPLGNLVYHDCIMVPWNWFNNWGIPKGENGDLYGALNAGMPYIHPYGNSLCKVGTDNRTADIEMMSDEELKKELARIAPLCKLQARLYNKEMIKHEFLGSYRKQRTTFSDGTSITIDLDKNTYKVTEPKEQ
ncbi:MAG: hypothetical protein IJE93_08310 [Clostridia bacterium]|nr:hypothetical protein [Clostridia bacterium]